MEEGGVATTARWQIMVEDAQCGRRYSIRPLTDLVAEAWHPASIVIMPYGIDAGAVAVPARSNVSVPTLIGRADGKLGARYPKTTCHRYRAMLWRGERH